MTRDQIVNQLSTNKRYKDYCKALCQGKDIWNDLYQEFILTVLLKPNEFIEKVYSDGAMHKWCISVILNHNKKRFKQDRLVAPRSLALYADQFLSDEVLGWHKVEVTDQDDKEKHIPINDNYLITLKRMDEGNKYWHRFSEFSELKKQTHERFKNHSIKQQELH